MVFGSRSLAHTADDSTRFQHAPTSCNEESRLVKSLLRIEICRTRPSSPQVYSLFVILALLRPNKESKSESCKRRAINRSDVSRLSDESLCASKNMENRKFCTEFNFFSSPPGKTPQSSLRATGMVKYGRTHKDSRAIICYRSSIQQRFR